MNDVISCSRKTDIPAFHYQWLQEVLEAGRVDCYNPFSKKTFTVSLEPWDVHSIVLWSKNFANVLKDPGFLDIYNLYFQFTITGYSRYLEPGVIDSMTAVKQLHTLANRYSPLQINWRFDPIIISEQGESGLNGLKAGTKRLEVFERLCKLIAPSGVNRCTISFATIYDAVQKRFEKRGFQYFNMGESLQQAFATRMVEIASKYGIQIYSCSNPALEGVDGILKSHCVDGDLLSSLFKDKASKAKDAGQRETCGCTKSKDIGSYEMRCRHACLYCYARPDEKEGKS